MSRPSWFHRWIIAHDMTVEQACRKSRCSRDTFGLLVAGYDTLPIIALEVGRNLGMTQEEVKHIGHSFADAEQPINRDPEWWTHLGKKRVADTNVWLDRKKLYMILNGRNIDIYTWLKRYGRYDGVNAINYNRRIKYIEELEELMGLERGALTIYGPRPKITIKTKLIPATEKILRRMDELQMSERELIQRYRIHTNKMQTYDLYVEMAVQNAVYGGNKNINRESSDTVAKILGFNGYMDICTQKLMISEEGTENDG